MSIIFRFTADNSDVVNKLSGIQEQMSKLSWADMFNDVDGGKQLAESFERLATNGVEPLQELEQATAAQAAQTFQFPE